MAKRFAKKRRKQLGQAMIEYMLMLALVVGVVSSTGFIFRKTVFKMWKFMSKQIAPGCPGCIGGPE